MAATSVGRSLHPLLVPLVEECLRNDRLNGHSGHVAVTGVKTSALDSSNVMGVCDRFTIAIPYCGTHLKWEVIFDRLHPEYSPDVIFSSEDEQCGFNPNIDNIQALSSWDITNHCCLCLLIEQLLNEYRKHHLDILSSHQRLYFEYNTLTENHSYNIDLHCTPSEQQDQYEPVTRFYILLSVDFTALPPYLTKDNPGSTSASLTVVFHPPNASRVESTLHLSSQAERILGPSNKIKLPSWNSDSYLMDYVPLVHKILQDKVDSLIQSFVYRKEFFASILSVMGQSILEYDTEGYKKLAFLLEYQGFSFICHVNLSDHFPKDPLVVSLNSIYHKLNGIPLQCNVKELPFNSQWEPDEMIYKLKSHLAQNVPKFIDLCKTKGEFL